MADERRRHERVSTSLAVKWYGLSGIHEARVSDISLGGCFVDTDKRVEMNEIVSLEIGLPSGEWLALRGEVISFQPRIGFGLAFTSLTDDEQLALTQLIT